VELEVSLSSARRTVLLLSKSGVHFGHCFSHLRIAKTVSNTSAQHALGQDIRIFWAI